MPQHPLSLEFWDDYNTPHNAEFLGLPAESDWNLYPPDFIDSSLIRNPLIHQLSRDMGRYSPRTRFAECFLNTSNGPVAFSGKAGGDYFGFYTIEEKIKRGKNRVNVARLDPQDTLPPQVTGGYVLKIDSYDSSQTTFSDAASQNPIVFVYPPRLQMSTAARQPQLHYISNYFAQFGSALWSPGYANPATGYPAYIDVDSWIDYHLLECFIDNEDAFRLSGYFFKDRDRKIEMGPHWDLHISMSDTPTQWASGQTDFFSGTNGGTGVRWWPRLFTDPDFWQRWIDRWAEVRSQILTTSHINAVADGLSAQLTKAVPREVARWGFGNSYRQEISSLKSWASKRLTFIDSNMLGAPVFSCNGGVITQSLTLTISASTREANSSILYTLDGTDPRLPGGAISPLALSNLNTATLTLTNNARVFARNWNPAHHNLTGHGNPPISSPWSAPTIATFVAATPPLAITEIMYHPPPGTDTTDRGQFEFIELKNVSSNPLVLPGIRFTHGIDFQFTAAGPITNLAPGAYVVIVRDQQAFLSRYPSVTNIAGQYTNKLDNAGERLTLEGAFQEPILDFRFGDQWCPAADGAGSSLVIRDESSSFATWGEPTSWRASSRWGGSPGQADPLPPEVPAVVINEILSHPGAGQADSIELFNPTPSPADIGGWFLTDNLDRPTKYSIAAGVVIPAGGYRVFTSSEFGSDAADGFGLSSLGESVYLLSGDGTNLTGYAHGYQFAAQLTGITFGRLVTTDGREHFVAQRANTLGGSNSGPKVGPVIISEILYSPPSFGLAPDQLDQYVELRNISNQAVPLFDPLYPGNVWQVQGSIQYTFPPGVSMPPRSYLLLVSFDPIQDPIRLGWFRQRLGVPADSLVYGPYQGNLADETLGVALYQPDYPVASPSDQEGSVPQVLVEQVHYSSLPPWPGDADATGKSLQRQAAAGFGDDPANWRAASPTPGSLNEGAAALDSDSDGMPDELELLAGTDPLNPQDFLRLGLVSVHDGSCLLQFWSHPGLSYAVEKLAELGESNTWLTLQDHIIGAEGPQFIADSAANGASFYRLRLTPY